MKYLTRIIAASTPTCAMLLLALATHAQDPGWPRQIVKPSSLLKNPVPLQL
jgi:hypothetical protein